MSVVQTLMESDYFMQLAVLSSVILLGALTYLFGYKSRPIDVDETESAAPEITKQKKSSKIKEKKKVKEVKEKPAAPVVPVPAVETLPETVKQPIVEKPAAAKKEPVQPVKAQTKGSKKNKVIEAKVVEVVNKAEIVEESGDSAGWITVKDKKKKTTETVPEVKSEEKKVPVVEKVVEAVVVAKKPAAQAPKAVVAPVVPVAPVVAQVVKEEVVVTAEQAKIKLLSESINELSNEDGNDWLPANPKANKKNSKSKQSAEPAKETVKQTVPESTGSPVNKKKQAKVEAEKTVAAPTKSAAAKADSLPNDKNNNVISEESKLGKNKQQVKTDKKPAAAAASTTDKLKQTSLTESMIIIDPDFASKSNRTESNQSSSESLQDLDVDGDDGWATITSKKKRTVRREV